MSINDYMTAKQVAEHAGLQYKSLWTYLKRGTLPTADLFVGNKPLWNKSTIDQWMSERRTIKRNDTSVSVESIAPVSSPSQDG